jgi:hypothetical protein
LKPIDFTCTGNDAAWEAEQEKIKPYHKCKGVLIKHFEYDLGDKSTNDKKLAFIETILSNKIPDIIIVSTIHPEAFLTNLRTDKTNTDFSQLAIENNYYQWVSVFSSFEMFYFPLSVSTKKLEEKSLADLISNEGMFGSYLPDVKDKLVKYIEEHKNSLPFNHEVKEEMILRFQNLAYPYYLSIWNSLTRDEQYLLYDLAEDGLTNYKSRDVITTLFNKGLIVNRQQLPAIMNMSFKNFILTEVKSGSAILDDKIRSEGSLWHSFKLPFYIVIASVVIFIFYTQQDTFNKMTTFLTTFAALIPLLLKLFGFMSASKSDAPFNPPKTT